MAYLTENVLAPKPTDYPANVKAKDVMVRYLKERYPISDLHRAATVLDPRFKAFSFLPPAVRQNAQAEALTYIRANIAPSAPEVSQPEPGPEPEKKKARTPLEEFMSKVSSDVCVEFFWHGFVFHLKTIFTFSNLVGAPGTRANCQRLSAHPGIQGVHKGWPCFTLLPPVTFTTPYQSYSGFSNTGAGRTPPSQPPRLVEGPPDRPSPTGQRGSPAPGRPSLLHPLGEGGFKAGAH